MAGKSIAQKELYALFAGRMYALCLRYVKSGEEAQDILQDGFVTVFTHIGQFRREGSLEGWIRRIMVNTALQHLRKTAGKGFISLDESYHNHPDDSSGVLPALQASELMKLVKGLPDGYRTIFNLYAIEGYSHKEIAGMLEISEGTSKSQLARARALLQQKIRPLMAEKSYAPGNAD